MAEEARRSPTGEWRGSPLQMGSGLDPYGIQEIVIRFDAGEEILKPRMRGEYRSYELHEAATYLDSLSHKLRLSHG